MEAATGTGATPVPVPLTQPLLLTPIAVGTHLWLGWYTPCYFFIALISYTLGLHRFYLISSNKYKDKDKGVGARIPPHPMEANSMTTQPQRNIVICGDIAVVGML